MEITTNMIGRLRDFATEELLSRTGLQRRTSAWTGVLPAVGIFAGGVLLGIGIGMLFAPQSGADTRADIRRRASNVGARAQEIYGNVMHQADPSVPDAEGAADPTGANGGKPRATRQGGGAATDEKAS